MFYDKTIKDRQRERERERNIEKRRLFLEFIAMLVPLPAFILIALYLSKAYYYYFSFFRLLKSVISILAGFFLLQHQHSLCWSHQIQANGTSETAHRKWIMCNIRCVRARWEKESRHFSKYSVLRWLDHSN